MKNHISNSNVPSQNYAQHMALLDQNHFKFYKNLTNWYLFEQITANGAPLRAP